jgi:hypothetical protein
MDQSRSIDTHRGEGVSRKERKDHFYTENLLKKISTIADLYKSVRNF